MTQFDDLAMTAFSHVLDMMGEKEDAVWLTSEGVEIPGRVLFKYPTMPSAIGSADRYEYEPDTPTAEYYKGTFHGLKEASDRQSENHLIIRGDRYFVSRVFTKFDGDTYVAELTIDN
jgi:hypothetical protein